jgi:hypothetical protein
MTGPRTQYHHNVRTHQRAKPGGGTTTVHQHQRKGGRPNPRHAWKMARRGYSHHRKGHKGMAAGFFAFAAVEAVAWVTGSTLGIVLGLLGGLALVLSMALLGRKSGDKS